MIETILALIIIAQLVFIGWLVYQYHSQDKRLVKAILSKNVQDFTSSEIAEKPMKNIKEVVSDLTPLSELDDNQFTKAIRGTLKKA